MEVEPCQGSSANKKVWERIQKRAILKQHQTHFNTKREKGVGTPSPRVPAPLTPEPCTLACRRSTFYQHLQFLNVFWSLVQRKTKT